MPNPTHPPSTALPAARPEVPVEIGARGRESAPVRLSDEIDRLRKLNQVRTQFINTAAHEFATPLTPLRLQVNMLKNEHFGPLNERQRVSIETMERNLERLSNLVQDVLDVSRLEANRFQIQRQPADVGALLALGIQSYETTAHEAGITLQLVAPPILPAEVDPDRISQVLANLLSNAFKFTPRGGRIDVRARNDGPQILVEIQDSGIGIKPDDFPKLFQPFSQVHDTQQQTRAGSGLGLSICQGILNQHGGRIWVESAGPGRGTTFTFTIPVKGTEPDNVGMALLPAHDIKRQVQPTGWKLFYFKCPDCGSRDIEVKLIRNRYECNACTYVWK